MKILNCVAGALLLAGALLAQAPVVRADSVTDGPSSFDVNGVGISPYGGSVNGVSTPLFCVDFSSIVQPGDTWQATPLLLDSGADFTDTKQGNAFTYDELAYLLDQMVAAPDHNTAAAYQFAIWSLSGFDDTETGSLSAANLLLAAQDAVNDGFTGAGWELLTPDAGQKGQEMMVRTPEPLTLLLLAFGLALLAVWRKRQKDVDTDGAA